MADVPGIDHDAVSRWFVGALGDDGPFTFDLIVGGNSNLTFRVTSPGNTYALRRPPLGHVLESAHDMGREYRVISALGGSGVPVPDALGLCADPEVNGVAFYVMSFVEGIVPHDAHGGAEIPESDRAGVAESIVDVLAALHALDPDDVGLGELGRREDYVARQLRRWHAQWEASKQREIPAMDEAHDRLAASVPPQKRSTIVHGDFRLGNAIVADRSIAAMLDWELCTLGDPMADLGYLLNSWLSPDEPIVWRSAATQAGGFGTRDQVVERYAAASGADMADVAFYEAFQSWRLGAILEGVYARYRHGAMGSTEGVDLVTMAAAVEQLADRAVERLSA